MVRLGSLTKDNVNQLKKLAYAVFPIQYSSNFYQKLLAEKDENLIRLAYVSDNVVGALATRIEPDNKVHIMILGVLFAYRRQGIGKLLLL